MLLALLLACPATETTDSGKDDSGLPDDSGSGGEDTATFDEDCFAQVMKSQVVCECPELRFDWSGLTADSAGAAFGPADVKVVHWYIFEMPVSSVNGALCAGGELGSNSFATGAAAGDVVDANATSATVDVGSWTRQTGVLALYDVAAEDGAAIWPRAAAVFTFDDEATNDEVVVEGRGDVYTAP